MRPTDPKKAIQEHFRNLLRAELEKGGRGAGARITASTGIKSSQISNMISRPPTRNPGLDTMHALARHWGRTYAEIEAEALGAPPQSSRRGAVSERPGLAEFLRLHPGAEPAIVALLRDEERVLDGVELNVEYFEETYDRLRRARDDARRIARGGGFSLREEDRPPSPGALSEAADKLREEREERESRVAVKSRASRARG